MSDQYFPPEGLRFRLIGYQSNRALVADWHLRDYDPKDIYDDQWFTLQEGAQGNENYYIASTAPQWRGKVIYSKWGDTGMYDKGKYADQYLTFEPGTGAREGTFRILNRHDQLVLVSKYNVGVYNYESWKDKSDEEFFSFEFENTEITGVDFDIQNATISETEQESNSEVAINEGEDQEQMEVDMRRMVNETSSFKKSTGFSITVGATFSFGAPGIAGGEIKSEMTTVTNFEWGNSRTEQVEVGEKVTVNVPGRYKQEVVGLMQRSKIDIPCTIHSISKETRVPITTKSIYRGETYWGFESERKPPVPIDA